MIPTKHIIVAAAVLHKLTITYKVPKPDDVPLVDGTEEDPDNPRAKKENKQRQQPRATKNFQEPFKRRQIIGGL